VGGRAMTNRAIEESIISYYEDFYAIHELRENFEGYIQETKNIEICDQIEEIIYNDLIKQCKSDVLHYIIEDLGNMLDWDYITTTLQDVYFAEPCND
jgi:hypothetical protein